MSAMVVHDFVQGSPEWLAHRRSHFNASDAPAMMGCSPYKTRAQLLRELHTGIAPDADAGQQRRFDDGHRVEALARPLAEEFIGAELFPITASNGRYSASFDGLTLDEMTGFEHKALSAELRECMEGGDESNRLPLMHRVQMEQQMLVSGAERVLFMASAWDAEGNLIEERHCWYQSDPLLRQQIIDGWGQFERELAAYVLPAEAPAAPVGKSPEQLPALRIEVTGQVTASNLAEFKQTALAAIRSVNRDLTTDEHFADAEKAVKWCSEVESRLEAAKQHALSQTTSIDELFRTIDDISAEARRVRLDLDKLVTRRKVEVKELAVARVRRDLDAHIAELNAEIAPMALRPFAADFAGTIKGKKTMASVNDALAAELANAKIAVEAQAKAIRGNLARFQADADGFEFLFADLAAIIHKAADDFALQISGRIASHKAAEEARARQRAEAEARAAEQRRQAEEASRAAAEAAARAAATTAAVVAPASPAPVAQPAAPTITVPPQAATEPATLKLGAICDRLGFVMNASFIADTLGIKPARVEGASKLYRERDFARICAALQQHIERVYVGQQLAAA